MRLSLRVITVGMENRQFSISGAQFPGLDNGVDGEAIYHADE